MKSVRLIKPLRFTDDRGWFSETYSRRNLSEQGLPCEFVQDNHSMSRATYVLRGLHFQAPPYAQDKLVRCVKGRIFDVAVDIRRGSPTYGQYLAMELTAKNGHQLFIPSGFAHGFLTLEPDSEVIYKCSENYMPSADGGIRWNSAGIDWPLPTGAMPQLSVKDEGLPALADFASPFAYDEPPLDPIEV